MQLRPGQVKTNTQSTSSDQNHSNHEMDTSLNLLLNSIQTGCFFPSLVPLIEISLPWHYKAVLLLQLVVRENEETIFVQETKKVLKQGHAWIREIHPDMYHAQFPTYNEYLNCKYQFARGMFGKKQTQSDERQGLPNEQDKFKEKLRDFDEQDKFKEKLTGLSEQDKTNKEKITGLGEQDKFKEKLRDFSEHVNHIKNGEKCKEEMPVHRTGQYTETDQFNETGQYTETCQYTENGQVTSTDVDNTDLGTSYNSHLERGPAKTVTDQTVSSSGMAPSSDDQIGKQNDCSLSIPKIGCNLAFSSETFKYDRVCCCSHTTHKHTCDSQKSVDILPLDTHPRIILSHLLYKYFSVLCKFKLINISNIEVVTLCSEQIHEGYALLVERYFDMMERYVQTGHYQDNTQKNIEDTSDDQKRTVEGHSTEEYQKDTDTHKSTFSNTGNIILSESDNKKEHSVSTKKDYSTERDAISSQSLNKKEHAIGTSNHDKEHSVSTEKDYFTERDVISAGQTGKTAEDGCSDHHDDILMVQNEIFALQSVLTRHIHHVFTGYLYEKAKYMQLADPQKRDRVILLLNVTWNIVIKERQLCLKKKRDPNMDVTNKCTTVLEGISQKLAKYAIELLKLHDNVLTSMVYQVLRNVL